MQAGLVTLAERSSDQTSPLTHTLRPSHSSDRLDELLSSSIREVLGFVVGRQGRDAICDYLAANGSFNRENICRHLPKLLELLDEMFGTTSGVISRSIARDLFGKLGFDFPKDRELTFFDYIEVAKIRLSAGSVAVDGSNAAESNRCLNL